MVHGSTVHYKTPTQEITFSGSNFHHQTLEEISEKQEQELWVFFLSTSFQCSHDKCKSSSHKFHCFPYIDFPVGKINFELHNLHCSLIAIKHVNGVPPASCLTPLPYDRLP
ncbi:hypothetical protein GDO81_014918 [Engystomops pustulosus]|uniref:Uncharacterized protein n=1 Tax=Engystomops pustulosus TaxID=76066 RepID=A0AAV7AJV8_ENGPU|nr:hypothetical protein GDO81_014918 [Engystomops pustulosus]